MEIEECKQISILDVANRLAPIIHPKSKNHPESLP